MDLEALLKEVATVSLLSDGVRPEYLLANGASREVVERFDGLPTTSNGLRIAWTKDEEKFVSDNLPYLPVNLIAEKLGRTPHAIKIRRNRRDLGNTRVGYSASQVAQLLGKADAEVVLTLIKYGHLQGRLRPLKVAIWDITETDLLRFVMKPNNWVFFDTERVYHPKLRKAIQYAKERWNDEWWTPSQAAAYHNCSRAAINNHAYGPNMTGKIRGGREKSVSRKNKQLPGIFWYSWHFKKSDVLKAKIHAGNGIAKKFVMKQSLLYFLFSAHCLGLSPAAVEAMSGYKAKMYNSWRTRMHHRSASDELAQMTNPPHMVWTGYEYYIDFRHYVHKFHHLRRALEMWRSGRIDKDHKSVIATLMWKWSRAFGCEIPHLRQTGKVTYAYLKACEAKLVEQGMKPLSEGWV